MYIDNSYSTYFSGSAWAFPSSEGAPKKWRAPQSSGLDLALVPGELATAEVIENEQNRKRLIDALNLFCLYGFSMHSENNAIISEASKDRSVALLNALPRRSPLPKVAPDGDRGVVMVWDRNGGQLLLTVDEQHLHCVVNAGTSGAIYYDDLDYDGVTLPQQVTQAIGI
jgi:hypothetical protein